jgi:hypothetical protein
MTPFRYQFGHSGHESLIEETVAALEHESDNSLKFR